MPSYRGSLSPVAVPLGRSETTNEIAGGRDSEAVLRTLASKLRHSVELKTLQITLYGSECDVALVHVLDPPQQREDGEIVDSAEGSPARVAWRDQRPLVISVSRDTTRFPRYVQWMKDSGIQAEWVMPITSARRCLGAIGFGLHQGRCTESERSILQTTAEECAATLNDILLRREAQWARAELDHERDRSRLLLEINNALVSHLDLDELWKAIAESLQRVVAHEFSGIALYDQQSSGLRRSGSRDGGVFPEEYIPIEGSAAGFAFRSGKALVLTPADVDRYPRTTLRRFRDEKCFGSGCMLPLISHGRKLGVLALVSRRERAFGREQLATLDGVAVQISIAVENALAHRELESLKNRLREEKLYLDEEISTACDFELIGNSEAFLRILKQVEQVAPTDATILIEGETGSGKEIIARAIHQLSRRRERTMVKVNCSAIPTGLLESEFFGHEKGSFTGAIGRRTGRFELAHQGTLFLDEVGDIPLELQPKLLRVLQEKEIERIGGSKTIQVDVRLVAATNADLEQMVADREFRSDLYYRLNVFPIKLPPLRERATDIIPLAQRFAQSFARRFKKAIEVIPPEVQQSLIQYHWPGNIRELQNVIERAVIVSTGPALEVSLPEPRTVAKDVTLAGTEREYIIRELHETNWVVSGRHGAASRLGLNRSTLQSKMRKLGIRRPPADDSRCDRG